MVLEASGVVNTTVWLCEGWDGAVAGSVLILGSGPDVVRCTGWDLSGFAAVVAINNAWRVRPDWSYCVYPDDFPEARRPVPGPRQRLVTSDVYVPAQNRFGGVVYAGATMAFTASYWVLDALEPRVIAYLGCDMMYDRPGHTHFYGSGAADPLRNDPTLQSLEAKARRFQALAAREGCALANLSDAPSRLPYPRATVLNIADVEVRAGDDTVVAAALKREADCAMVVPSGRYWEEPDRIDPVRLAEIDADWLAAFDGL